MMIGLLYVDAGLAGPILKLVISSAIWRLKSKNRDFGENGVRLKFLDPKGQLVIFAIPIAVITFVVASIEILPSEDS